MKGTNLICNAGVETRRIGCTQGIGTSPSLVPMADCPRVVFTLREVRVQATDLNHRDSMTRIRFLLSDKWCFPLTIDIEGNGVMQSVAFKHSSNSGKSLV